MDLRDADVQLSAQRLQELMLWHGKDEGNLPPAATLVNLSRDTIAALCQLQQTRTGWPRCAPRWRSYSGAATRGKSAPLCWTRWVIPPSPSC